MYRTRAIPPHPATLGIVLTGCPCRVDWL